MNAVSSQRKDHLDTLAISLLLACCMFWGLQQILVKAIMDEVAPLFQASLRCIGASVLLMVWCRLRGIRLFDHDGSLCAGLMTGGLFAAEFACIYLGLQATTASRFTIFLYTAPFWVAALVPLFVKSERLRPVQWLGMACAFVAVAFAMRESMGNGSATGDLLGLAAGALWGLTTVAIKAHNLTRISPEKLLLYQIAATALVLPWLSWSWGETWSLDWSPLAWGSMFAQTVIGAFASYLTWMWMLGRYPATRISVFVFLTPLFALLFGTWFLSEAATPTLLSALALVALGIVLVNRK
jgi:drug/metabolite transporter (DMT)-like permease